MFDVIYDSPWHHPVLCWAATPLVLGLLWRARPRPGAAREAQLLWRLALFGQLLIALDALFTGSWSPLAAGTAASTGAGILFVILGDLRYFVLLERYSPGAPPSGPGGLGRSARGFLRALGLSLLVPILFAGVSQVLPAVFAEPRRKFLGYELLFLGLLLVGGGVFGVVTLAASAYGLDEMGNPNSFNSAILGAGAGLFAGFVGGFVFELLARVVLLPVYGRALWQAPLMAVSFVNDSDHVAGLTIRPRRQPQRYELTFANDDVAAEFKRLNRLA